MVNGTDCARPVSRESGNGFQKWAAQRAERSSLIALPVTGSDGWPAGIQNYRQEFTGHLPESGTMSVTRDVSGINRAPGLPVFLPRSHTCQLPGSLVTGEERQETGMKKSLLAKNGRFSEIQVLRFLRNIRNFSQADADSAGRKTSFANSWGWRPEGPVFFLICRPASGHLPPDFRTFVPVYSRSES
ncbi:hypothetical protein OFAG_02362 [Oxalobacter formigenes HOxBLS]|uniref:Uncharacterized protein n=1 Tax=Oxalobacter paraformigenes TaxID=556268 RepID=T5LTJ4_9BURK|nr:hypothetical protein OFAG_02362 [Oxalobacter paraformigenes]